MRDPDGTVLFEGPLVRRILRQPIGGDHFLRSPLAADLVADGSMVAFEQHDERTLLSARLPFVTYPFEWCDSQVQAAARLTLDLAGRAVDAGFELKDASAWNVLFNGARPLLCDHLSFGALVNGPWWAAGQFSRHFVLPLQLSRSRGMQAREAFARWRDGVPAEAARGLLGFRRYLTRTWMLVAGGESEVAEHTVTTWSADRTRRFRGRLHASLHWMLDGVDPGRRLPRSHWAGYTAGREHYPASSVDTKRSTVVSWLQSAGATWVMDLGSNTGEFTRLALEQGARVVALDSDHASVESLRREHPDQDRLITVLADLDDLCAGRGWLGEEIPGLHQRCAGQFGMVMMLALIHHLAVGSSIPLVRVAEMAYAWTTRWAIVEWLHEEDPQLRMLCVQRRRSAADFSLAAQRQAFSEAGFAVVAEVNLAPAARTLALLRKS